MISKEPEQLLSGILNKQTVPKGCFGVICIIEKKNPKEIHLQFSVRILQL